MNPNFISQILKFNTMYGLPIADSPTTKLEPVLERMAKFKPILADELSEVDDIVANCKAGVPEIDTLVEIADWLCDIIVYCSSEAARYGIPVVEVLDIIMQSNYSKLDKNGNAIIKDGKVQKSELYWKPEPLIKALLLRKQEAVNGVETSGR